MKVFSLLSLVALVCAKPHNSENDKKAQAAEYARLHPNPDPTYVDPELGDYYQGDIELAPGQTPDSVGVMNGDTRVDLWPGGALRYELDPDYSEEAVAAIQAGIIDLVASVNPGNNRDCVSITPRVAQPNYVYVTDFSGCSSYVGMIGGSQRMSLTAGCWNRHGTIMHEFLHALGFHHEQMRSDRNDNIIVDWSNIQPGRENNFFMLDADTMDLLNTDYDYGSVMHYGAYGFAIDPSQPTIIPLDEEAEIGQRTHLSDADIERVQIFYGCIPASETVHFKHLADKLDHLYKP